MRLLALIAILLFAVSAGAQSPTTSEARLGPPPPAISALDGAYLTRFVRRHLEAAIRGSEAYTPPYVPETLRDVSCAASVTIRMDGRLLAAGDADVGPVLAACRQAAHAARTAAAKKQALTEDLLAGATLELELLGAPELIGNAGEPAADLSGRFEPGVHGLIARVDDREIRIRPSQLISLEVFCDSDDEVGHNCDRYAIAIENLQEKLGLKRQPPDRDPQAVKISRFRTRHWAEPKPGGAPVELISGMRRVAAGEITPAGLDAIAGDLARYLCYRQTSDGLFSYEFLPGRDMYWPEGQNWVRQIGAAWVVARYARETRDAAAAAATSRAIAAIRKMVQPLPGGGAASYIATPDKTHPLGATALTCLTLMDAPDSEQYTELTADLLNALASMQRPDGSFKTHFPPAVLPFSQDFYPGEALLAIARQYAATRDGKWREICDRAMPFYIQHFRANHPAMMVPWHIQAWGQLARTTQLRRYADFVYEMVDWVAAAQIRATEAPMCIYDGGIDVKKTGRSGIATAVYVEGLIEAARTAEAFGDTARAVQYRGVIRQALRFIVQLQFRPEECYYVQSPREVIGGVRAAPYDPSLRIDHTVHALAAILGAGGLEITPPATSQPAAR